MPNCSEFSTNWSGPLKAPAMFGLNLEGFRCRSSTQVLLVVNHLWLTHYSSFRKWLFWVQIVYWIAKCFNEKESSRLNSYFQTSMHFKKESVALRILEVHALGIVAGDHNCICNVPRVLPIWAKWSIGGKEIPLGKLLLTASRHISKVLCSSPGTSTCLVWQIYPLSLDVLQMWTL